MMPTSQPILTTLDLPAVCRPRNLPHTCQIFGGDRLFRAGLTEVLNDFGLHVLSESDGWYSKPDIALLLTDDWRSVEAGVAHLQAHSPSSKRLVLCCNADQLAYARTTFAGTVGVSNCNSPATGLYKAIVEVLEGQTQGQDSEQVFQHPNHRSAAESDKIIDGVSISAQECTILQGIASGQTNDEIAATAALSPVRTKSRIRTLLRKLGVANRTQAALWAEANGLVTGTQLTFANH